jgi:hypothetical protein
MMAGKAQNHDAKLFWQNVQRLKKSCLSNSQQRQLLSPQQPMLNDAVKLFARSGSKEAGLPRDV